jgi:hypothetical protein
MQGRKQGAVGGEVADVSREDIREGENCGKSERKWITNE